MQSSMANQFAQLIFDTPLTLPTILSPHDRLYFGAFTKHYTPVTLKQGTQTRVYTNLQTGESFWVSPDWLLSALLVNHQIDKTGRFEPIGWYTIPATPLLVVHCKGSSVLTANTLNNRAIIGIPPELIDLLEEGVVRQVFGHPKQKPKYSTIEAVLKAVSLRESASATVGNKQQDILHVDPASSTSSQNSLQMLQEPLHVTHQSVSEQIATHGPAVHPPEPSKSLGLEDLSQITKEGFRAVLRDLSQPVLGNHEPILSFLKAVKDPRVLAVPVSLHKPLVEEFYASAAQESKLNVRSKVQTDFMELVKVWRTQTTNNPKFMANYNLFKEKFKSDKRFKEAQKYFDLEKLFKEGLENFKTGMLSSTAKAAIDSFIGLMKELKQRGCPVEHILSQSEAKDFTKLSEEDKKRVFDEFQKTL